MLVFLKKKVCCILFKTTVDMLYSVNILTTPPTHRYIIIWFAEHTVSSFCLTSYTMLSGSATAMVQFMTLSVFLCIIGLLSETLNSLSLEAEVGDNVTIWCQHDLKRSDNIFWFKHTSDSVPFLLGCKRFLTSAPSEPCYFFSESERIVMSVHGSKTSLTITAVNVSDTGLYYCSFMHLDQVRFSNTTYLQMKAGNKTLSTSDRAEGSVSLDLSFILNVVFGAVIVFLLIILKHRKTHAGDTTDRHDDEDQEPDSVNYAALQFSKKKTKTGRFSELIYSHVVYNAIR
ncbi:uncharacterized protein LOC131343458 isoform X1 [Hemibagrus wyckioides]|uniref:uncharacterized protein LOC131343458 isoform X1 n=1 Tax=Hemibagrus wyckioides TaxID=337641 RepID=UPI00266DD7AE|nr:uncharacterized protein LOC131343458 isoform X1 [Hemibagrus wyckioides]